LIDWVSFTVKVPLENIYSLLKLPAEDFVEMKRGLNGYLGHLRRGSITILYNGQVEGMGVHVFMSGEGCREYEHQHGNRWKVLFLDVFSLGGHFTRLDSAIDDYEGYFKIEEIAEKVKRRELRSLFKKASLQVGFDLADMEGNKGNNGMTVYFGSNSSMIKVRMYEKSKQQRVSYFWNRVEVETHDERANLFAQEIVGSDDLGKLTAGVLKRYLNFVEPSNDSNKSRWDVSEWWNKFLGDVEKVKLSVKKIQRTLAEVTMWVERQVSPSLALMKEKMGRAFTSYMQYLLFDGKDRWNPKHYALLAAGT
jgi:phage replication initiation protein